MSFIEGGSDFPALHTTLKIRVRVYFIFSFQFNHLEQAAKKHYLLKSLNVMDSHIYIKGLRNKMNT